VLVCLYFPPASLDETGYTLYLDAFRPRNSVHQLEIYHFSTRAELKDNLNRRGFVFTALSVCYKETETVSGSDLNS
jgi:hypothetical protein